MYMFAEILLQMMFIELVESICPEQNNSADMRFTEPLGREDEVRINRAVAILCCAEGYDNITWSQKKGDTWSPFSPPKVGDDNAPALQEDGQVLRFYSAKFSDQSTYRCIVTKEGHPPLQHLTDLKVIDCEKLATGPIITDPFPENQTIDELGGNVTFHCTGYFGCASDPKGSDQFVVWTSLNGTIAETLSDRYTVHEYKQKKYERQKTLTITSVNEDDLKRTFICRLFTLQKYDNITTRKVKIKMRDKPGVETTPWVKIVLVITGSLLVIAVIIMSIIYVRCKYGPQIRLFMSSRIAFLVPRRINNEKYIYHVFIYHADADEEIALQIKQKLNEENFDVFIHADIEGNQNILRMFSEKTAQSALVVFLYSDALRNDHVANFLLQSFINERKGKDILFLELADYKPKDIMSWARHVNDKGRLVEEKFDDCQEVIDNETIEMIKKRQNDMVDDLQFWKVLPRLKIPGKESNKREQSYFWCSLQNRIPRFQKNHYSGEVCVLPPPERNLKKKMKRDDTFLLTQSCNGDKAIINKALVINPSFTTDEVIGNSELSIPNDYESETASNGERSTEIGATNYAYFKVKECGEISLLPNQSASCSSVLSSEEIMCRGLPEITVEQSNTNQSNKYSETAKQRNNNLNLIIDFSVDERGPSSCSPESGYVTSPVEKTYNIKGFLPLLDETKLNDTEAQNGIEWISS